HSVRPMIQEYVGNKSWDEGMAAIERRERTGFELLKKVFKRNPSCYGQPGFAWVPQMYPVIKKWGVQADRDDAVSLETLNKRPSEEDYRNLGKLLTLAKPLPRLRFMTAADALRIYPDRSVGRDFSAAEIEELCKVSATAINYQYLGKEVVVSAAEVFTLVLQ